MLVLGATLSPACLKIRAALLLRWLVFQCASTQCWRIDLHTPHMVLVQALKHCCLTETGSKLMHGRLDIQAAYARVPTQTSSTASFGSTESAGMDTPGPAVGYAAHFAKACAALISCYKGSSSVAKPQQLAQC